jgi:hypothetical protein
VKREMIDMVPKAVSLTLVTYSKDSLQRELLQELYKPEVLDELLKESDYVVSRRKEVQSMVQALNKAEEYVLCCSGLPMLIHFHLGLWLAYRSCCTFLESFLHSPLLDIIQSPPHNVVLPNSDGRLYPHLSRTFPFSRYIYVFSSSGQAMSLFCSIFPSPGNVKSNL